jgi:hypothetical protein
MWVFIVLLLIAATIVTVRLFRNGARESSAETQTAAATATTVPSESRVTPTELKPVPATVATHPAQSASESEALSPYPPLATEQAGSPCPSCGTATVPGAKFCGECGHRLAS